MYVVTMQDGNINLMEPAGPSTFTSMAEFDTFVTLLERRATDLRETYKRLGRHVCETCSHQVVVHGKDGGCTVMVPNAAGVLTRCGCAVAGLPG